MIPDTQIRPDNLELNRPLLRAVGQLIIDWRPDVVVHIGDHFDFASLSQYDFKKDNKINFNGQEVADDLSAGISGMYELLMPLIQLQDQQRRNAKKQYRPKMHFTIGNHEQRVTRFPELRGLVDYDAMFEQFPEWEVHDYLKPVEIEGVHFVHYAYNPLSGKPIGGTAEYRLNKLKLSYVQGHEQTFKYAQEYLNDGRKISALIGGACYLHDEPYKGYQGNNHFRGCFKLHNVHDGMYDLEQVSVERLLGEH
jgi:hypothetical protein